MKAAVLGDNGVEIRDLPKPAPKPNEVLIKVRASSLKVYSTPQLSFLFIEFVRSIGTAAIHSVLAVLDKRPVTQTPLLCLAYSKMSRAPSPFSKHR